MSDKPMRWPNVAAEARNRAAEEAHQIIHELEELVAGKREFTETDRLRRIARALSAAYKICRLLEAVGAQTRQM